ncbi:MAG TPA: Tex-like N-terminal domain-containing protein, partial [Pirellulales bacterium]|nr:Tex-like N-terminal domain-containing protein [Pirellulales bacterium]
MASTVAIDLGPVSQSLNLASQRVQAVIDLLNAGNTVPFITRYRKDQTGGLDEEQIRQIQARVLKLRLLAERKQTILRSIELQGKLTPELAAAIEGADASKRLEDLYLPFKPKKQTLGATARQRGLEPLALEILRADPICADLDARARDFINSDKKVATAADALLGAGHILAEIFSERADLRGKLRAIVEQTGKLVSTATEPEAKPEAPE